MQPLTAGRHVQSCSDLSQPAHDINPAMPLSAKNNLDELYVKHRLLQAEAARLEDERDAVDMNEGAGADRHYILDIEAQALREEATKIGASISDILERDLQR